MRNVFSNPGLSIYRLDTPPFWACEEKKTVAPYALVVEDDPDVAFIFQRALQDAGYQADIVATGHKAQARLVFTTPDLILLDMHLPRLSGCVVLRQIRGQRRLDGVRVIVATGETQTGEEYRGEADYVLVKPVGYEKVRELAESLLPLAI